MKKPSYFLMTLLLASSCFPMKDAKLISGPTSISNIEAIEQTLACAKAELKKSEKADESITKIKLKAEIVDKVLSELGGRAVTPNFWSLLTNATSKELMLNINMHINRKGIENSPLPFQAVPYFFQELRHTNDQEVAYQIKTSNNAIYSFEIEGEIIREATRLKTKCSEITYDVSQIKLPEQNNAIIQVTEVYKCKVKNQSFDLVRMTDKSFIITKDENIQVSNAEIKIKDGKRKTTLKIDTKDVQLTLKFKKKTEKKVDDIAGFKTKIDLRTAKSDIDETGACERQIKSAPVPAVPAKK